MMESTCFQNRNHHSLNDGLGSVLRGLGRGDLIGPPNHARRRDRVSTVEEGPEAGTDEITTEVTFADSELPTGPVGA